MSSTLDLTSLNWLWVEWSLFSSLVLTFGILVLNYSELPGIFHRIVKYGKSANVQSYANTKYLLIEIPKRYFYHFYLFALILYINLAISASMVYFQFEIFGATKSKIIYNSTSIRYWLDFFGTGRLQSSVTPESVIIGLALLIIQVTRRLCECTMLSVYSNAKMNIIHYMFGYSFYFGVGLSILAEAPGFTGSVSTELTSKQYQFIAPCHVIGIVLFVWASYIQFDSHRILANLRKDTSGKVCTHEHSIPRGKWFDLISCPHYMAEILIYLSISIVMAGRSLTWWMVFGFVVVNQSVVGKINHSWYIEAFKDYPKSRKAVIPYLL